MKKEETEIEDIYGFLHEIQSNTDKMIRTTGLNYFCYRGENESYKTHSTPNLFRGPIFEMYNDIAGFEKNIIEEVSSNKLTKHEKNLEIAMDAQHGGFPSRLLDISFNSLTALFFAVTPHYNQRIDSRDDKDGQVIVYAIDKMVTSNSDYINDLYDKLITEKRYIRRFDGYYHYLIDYVELNPRIKAQQGGFILFCGNQHVPIQEWRQRVIKIPSRAKPLLRHQLKHFFDITMGSIYPEPSNKVDYLIEKSSLLVQDINHFDNIVKEIRRNLKWYDNRINYLANTNQIRKRNQKIIDLERYMNEIQDSLEDYKRNSDLNHDNADVKKSKDNIFEMFQELIIKINNRYGEKYLKLNDIN